MRIRGKLVILSIVLLGCAGTVWGQHPAIDELRGELKYKFALDFIRQRSQFTSMDDLDTLVVQDPKSIRRDSSAGPAELESFHCPDAVVVYDWHSHDGLQNYFLVHQYLVGGRGNAYLFTRDSIQPRLLDSSEVGPELHVEYLNGGLVLRSLFDTHGTGYSAEHLEILTVMDRRFTKLFHEYLEWFDVNNSKDEPRRRIAKVDFVDLDGDGFLDIDVTIRKEVSSELTPILPEDRVEYFWQKGTHTFKIPSKL
jgi:hypothetical protein